MKTFSVSNYSFKAASILELLIGMCVLILCLVCGLGMILPVEPLHSFGNAATIRTGLGNASYVIIGVEFIKMIATHKIEAVLDIIAFALSRDMIIPETTPPENHPAGKPVDGFRRGLTVLYPSVPQRRAAGIPQNRYHNIGIKRNRPPEMADGFFCL